MAEHAPIRVGVLGASGKMGLAVCRAVAAHPFLELVAAVAPRRAGQPLSELASLASDVTVTGELGSLVEAEVMVAVDFTNPSAAAENLRFCAANAIHGVCGTTGISGADLDDLASRFSGTSAPNLLVAPNFAISAALTMRFAELAAPFFDGVEVIELHHDQKRDAPSGTAIETARRIAFARAASSAGPFAEDPTTTVMAEGARGGHVEGVPIHSVRLSGLVAHEEVIFGSTGQSLTIRQDSYDRTSFMPGVCLACERIGSTSGFTYGLDGLITF